MIRDYTTDFGVLRFELMKIYGDDRSGNCLKVRWTCNHLGIAYDWIETLALTGATSDAAFQAINPAGQVPVVVLRDGRTLAQSNAIIWHLAEGSALIPSDAYDRAKMHEWMFWEQYSHEPVIAVRRAKVALLNMPEREIDQSLLPRGQKLLAIMDAWLMAHPWFSGPSFGLGDIALVAYTRFAPQGGWKLDDYLAVKAWVTACELALGLDAF
jgi:glutathione S-transferase